MGSESPSFRTFDRAVALFLLLIAFGLGAAILANAPLSFDGAFYFFTLLDGHKFLAFHRRLINFPLEAPLLAAAHVTNSLGLLRLIFSASYATVPAVGLLLCWPICRVRRPSMMLWPAISTCIIALPGQFVFVAETIMAAALLWPALLAVLLGVSPAFLPLVVFASVVATVAHPAAAGPLAVITFVTIISAIIRPETRSTSLMFAVFFGALLIVRILIPLDSYESQALSLWGWIESFSRSVWGWPLVAIAFAAIAASVCLFAPEAANPLWLLGPLSFAGVALIVWAIDPEAWQSCLEYRSLVAPLSMGLMSAAAFDELWWSGRREAAQRRVRLYALIVSGAIFLTVLSIQSLEWAQMSARFARQLAGSNRGCLVASEVTGVPDSPLGNWSAPFYAIDSAGEAAHYDSGSIRDGMPFLRAHSGGGFRGQIGFPLRSPRRRRLVRLQRRAGESRKGGERIWAIGQASRGGPRNDGSTIMHHEQLLTLGSNCAKLQNPGAESPGFWSRGAEGYFLASSIVSSIADS